MVAIAIRIATKKIAFLKTNSSKPRPPGRREALGSRSRGVMAQSFLGGAEEANSPLRATVSLVGAASAASVTDFRLLVRNVMTTTGIS